MAEIPDWLETMSPGITDFLNPRKEQRMKHVYEVSIKHEDGSWAGRRFAAESVGDAIKQWEKDSEHPVSSVSNQLLTELKVCRVQL